jgi:hypothetical protein
VALCRIFSGDKLNHIGRDWVGIYKTAAMEFSRNKSPASINLAEHAIQNLLRELPIADSKASVVSSKAAI